MLCGQLWCYRHPSLPRLPMPSLRLLRLPTLPFCTPTHMHKWVHVPWNGWLRLRSCGHCTVWTLWATPLHGHPHLPAIFPLWKWRARRRHEGDLSLFLVLKVSISAPPSSAFPICLRASPASVWGVPPSSQSLRKPAFCCLPQLPGRAGTVRGPRQGCPSQFTSGFHSCLLCSSPQR